MQTQLFDITVFYLEMLASPRNPQHASRDDLSVRHVPSPSVLYYRSLYNAVGEPYRWLSRRKMSDQQLASIIGDPLDELHVLHVGNTAAGFAELDRRRPNEIELVQFGLIPKFIGQGLGKWFLNWTIDKAFRYDPKRFWLHTCTLDHPAALPNYLKAGFQLYKQETIRREY
jgi:GNAT superfamily N-acetyltransferase